MENIKHKLTVLAHIAEEFNHKDVTWAIGASLLLYFKGITSEFHDIDIMIAEDDVETVKEILLSLGNIIQSKPNSKYKTKWFCSFMLMVLKLMQWPGLVSFTKIRSITFH